jgi:DNA-binding transcriptional MerR regulator
MISNEGARDWPNRPLLLDSGTQLCTGADLGLLRPASVDLGSGYRRYPAAQVEQARLVASLRQVGVPLAQIKVILSLSAAEADELAARFPDLTLRTEAAHEEAFVHLPSALGASQAQTMAVVGSLLNWAAEHQRQPSAGVRQIFIRAESSTAQTGPACDFAVPLTGADVSPWPAPAGSR